MVSLTDLAANPDLLIAFQRQQAAQRRLQQQQPAEIRTPSGVWMSALAQGLMNLQAAQADRRLEDLARRERDDQQAELAQARQMMLGGGMGGAAPSMPAAPQTAPAPLPGVRMGGPAAALPDNRDAPNYDPVAASRARLAALPGAPQEAPGGYRAPAGEGGVFAGLAPPSGRLGDVSAPPAQPAAAQPNPGLFQMAQQFAISRNPQVRALAPLLMQQYERQQQDARLAQQNARDDQRFQLQLAAQARAEANANRETFGAPVTEQGPDGRPLVVRYGSRGTRQVVEGATPEAPRAGLNPIQGYAEDGTPIVLLPRNDGTLARPALPEGVTLTPRTREINTGTEMVTVDQGGRVVARRPIDIVGRETAEAVGQRQGQEVAGASGAVRQAEQSIGLIDAVIDHPALRTATGALSFTGGIPGTPQFDFAQRVAQLQGRAFLDAFESLRGGGAITQIEGEKATQAIARLNRGVSAADFRQALAELREVLDAARQRAAARVPQAPQAQIGTSGQGADPPPAAQRQRLRFNPQTGDFE